MKSMAHVGEDSGLETRIQAAVEIALATQGHLACIYARPISTYLGISAFGGMVAPQSIFGAFAQVEARTRSQMEFRLSRAAVRWTYCSLTDELSAGLIAHGAMCDLIVLSRSPPGARNLERAIAITEVVLKASVPVLVLPEEGTRSFKVRGAAAIAWSGSVRAANALRAALPLLQLAKPVMLLVDGRGTDEGLRPAVAREYLLRHGVQADIVAMAPSLGAAPEATAAAARDLEADYMVTSTFEHSRTWKYRLGRASHRLLRNTPIPLLFTH